MVSYLEMLEMVREEYVYHQSKLLQAECQEQSRQKKEKEEERYGEHAWHQSLSRIPF